MRRRSSRLSSWEMLGDEEKEWSVLCLEFGNGYFGHPNYFGYSRLSFIAAY